MAWRDIFVSTTGDAGNTGLTEGSPWTIEKAMTSCVAEDYVWVKADGTYTLSATLSPAGNGSIANNKKIIFKGYNTTPGDASAGNFVSDMDYGQSYHQSAYDTYLNGIDTTKCVDIDADNGAFAVLTLSGKVNIDFHHFYLHNTFLGAGHHGVYMTLANRAIHFYNCKFADAYQGIEAEADPNTYGLYMIGCYFHDDLQAARVRSYVPGTFVRNCISQEPSKSLLNFNIRSDAKGSLVHNCLIIGGSRGVRICGPGLVFSNTFYDSGGSCVEGYRDFAAMVDVYNNIMVPDTDGSAIHVKEDSGEGVTVRNDYNCIRDTAGGAVSPVFTTAGTINAPDLGTHSIEEYPDFVDAANGDFRPRNPNVLRGGMPDIGGNQQSMGAVLQKHQFANRGRMMNPARLGIIR